MTYKSVFKQKKKKKIKVKNGPMDKVLNGGSTEESSAARTVSSTMSASVAVGATVGADVGDSKGGGNPYQWYGAVP